MLRSLLPEYTTVFAQNYDSAFLFYPFTQPHGSSRAGLGLFSKYPVSSALRRSFPISTSFSKFFDLDRCYSVSRIPVDNGKELVIFNLHMSAYGNSDAIRQGQIEMLCNDMAKEYEAGNYVLCGGDFNHDLKASEEDTESCESWAFPFPRTELPEHFAFCLDLLSSEEQAALWNSARNADMEYVPGVTYTVTLDGFIISDNIECLSYENVNTGYSYSDHDPVKIEFVLFLMLSSSGLTMFIPKFLQIEMDTYIPNGDIHGIVILTLIAAVIVVYAVVSLRIKVTLTTQVGQDI